MKPLKLSILRKSNLKKNQSSNPWKQVTKLNYSFDSIMFKTLADRQSWALYIQMGSKTTLQTKWLHSRMLAFSNLWG